MQNQKTMHRVLTLGNAIQSSESDPTEETIQELKDAMQEEYNSSYLSSIVRSMISITDGASVELPVGQYITDDGVLNLSMLTKYQMTGAEATDNLEADLQLFEPASKYLKAVILQHIHPFARETFKSDIVTLQEKYKHKMTFLPELQIESNRYDAETGLFMQLLEIYKQGRFQICFQMGITFLERSLGDLLVTGMDSFTCRQLKINDMLTTEKMKEILGTDVLFLLRLVSGPLQGMNLRNITWHGFLKDEEFHECYSSFLLLLILSLSDVDGVKETFAKEARRPMKTLLEFDAPIEFTFNLQESIRLVDETFFLPPNQHKQWYQVMHMYAHGNVYDTAVAMYPLLEHALRRLFAFVNQCENRVLSAETNKLYTTFDDILDPVVELNKTPNQLYTELGNPLMLALFDILIWKDGPRLRDKLSHGVIDPQGLPKSIVDRTVMIVLALCQKYSYRKQIVTFIDENYVPAFHPQMYLYKEIVETNKNLQLFWNNFARQHVEDSDENIEEKKGILMTVTLRDHVVSLMQRLNARIAQLRPGRQSSFLFHDYTSTDAPIDHAMVPCVIPLQYTGKVGNNVAPELLKTGVLRRVTVNVRNVTEAITTVYTEYDELVQSRQAYKKHREMFVKYKRNMFALYLMLSFIMMNVEELTYQMNPLEPGLDRRDIMLKLVNSLPVCNKHNAWSQSTKLFNTLLKLTEQIL